MYQKTISIIAFLILFITTVNASTNYFDDNILEVTCLGEYTGVFHSYIYFSNNSTSKNYYVIRTAWMLTYPKRIKNDLISRGIYIHDKNPTSRCEWTLRSKITKAGIYTGYIYEKNNEDKILREIAAEVLSTLYPSLEIALTIIGGTIVYMILCYIYIKCLDCYEC